MLEQAHMIKTERPHLFSPNENVIILFDIEGRPKALMIKQAVEKAVAANESLQCKITLFENGKAAYVRLEKPVYKIEVSDKDWKQIKNEEEHKAFDLESGEMARFFILENGEVTKLLIIAHHLAGDGLSLVYLAEDIMNALAGKDIAYKPLKIVDVVNLPKESDLKLIQKFVLKQMNKKWMKESKVFSYREYQTMFNNYWSSRRTETICETLSKRETNALLKKAKECKVSLNSLFTTVFLCAYKKQSGLGVAISIRDKNDRGMANHVSGLAISTVYDENKSFMQNTQHVHEEIYKWINDTGKKYLVLRFVGFLEPTLVDSASMTLYGGYQNKIAQNIAKLLSYTNKLDFGITNLTRLDIPQEFGKYRISNLIFVPPVVLYTQCVIGMASLGDEMNMVLNMVEDEKAHERRRFYAEAIRLLKNIEKI